MKHGLLISVGAIFVLSACSGPSLPPASLSQEQKEQLEDRVSQFSSLFFLPADGSQDTDRSVAPTAMVQANLVRSLMIGAPKGLEPKALTAQTLPTGCMNLVSQAGDADADGLPSNATYTVECAYVSDRGLVILSGLVNLDDDSDTDALSGFDLQRQNIKYQLQDTNEYWNYNDAFNLDNTGLGYNYSFTGGESNYLGQMQNLGIDGSYYPDSVDLTFSKGDITLSGSGIANISADEIIDLKMSSNNLALYSNCGGNTYVESGSISVTATSSTTGVGNYPMAYQNCEAMY